MNLSTEQLASAKAAIEAGTRLVQWMRDNSLSRSDIRPRQVLEQLKSAYGDEVIETAMSDIFAVNYGALLDNMVSRLISRPNVTVAMCDTLLARLQASTVDVQAKKDELQA